MKTTELKRRLRLAARTIISGQPSRYYEDEMVSFSVNPLFPEIDPNTEGKRLNIVSPSLSKSGAFGGLSTLLGLPLEVFKFGLEHKNWKIRFICTRNDPGDEDNLVLHIARRVGIDLNSIEFHYGGEFGKKVPVAEGDIFLGSLWYNQNSVMPLLEFQKDKFRCDPTPYIALIQDYEPGFHPWSSAYMMAISSYDIKWPRRLIINSNELAEFYESKGHKFEEKFVFSPTINAELKTSLEGAEGFEKRRQIIFYGRPDTRRNCFHVVKQGLINWSKRYDSADKWSVVSVGAKYSPFKLHGGASLSILGKLSLSRYAEELHFSAVGLSLMASPHPSYPPLEMAHFGALTVCNNFEHKDLGKWHENLRPVDLVTPDCVANALVSACEKYEESPDTGRLGVSLKPDYLEGTKNEVLSGITSLLVS